MNNLFGEDFLGYKLRGIQSYEKDLEVKEYLRIVFLCIQQKVKDIIPIKRKILEVSDLFKNEKGEKRHKC